jgi:phosphoribosylformimino-5-aminoimidazole carboxamide ribotide isomerase
MLILPAIDIRRGNCVRLFQGKAENETVYSSDPIEMALLWQSKGASMLHIVDLDGAFEGKPVNLNLIGLMRKQIQIPIEVGGGFRDITSIHQAFEKGADRVILGTVAIQNPQLVSECVRKYGPQVTVSIDVTGQFAAVHGWKDVSAVTFADLAQKMRDLGVAELLFTDTRRDGTLQGPDLKVTRAFLEAARVPVILSGGITSVEDIVNLKEMESHGLKGVVIGKALYDKKIQLEDALRVAA